MPGNNQQNALERIRRTKGATYLRQSFGRTVKSNRAEAERLLNEDGVSFPAVYIISSVTEANGMTGVLPYRAAYAMYLTTAKWGEKDRASLYLTTVSPNGSAPPPDLNALRWMIRTGADWDGPSAGRDSYDAALDTAAALLADNFDDPETMGVVADLIFRRYRRGLNVHDLTWGYFHTADPGSLMLIAKRLLSDNAADVELTCRLMGFHDPGSRAGRKSLFDEYSAWLAENRPYLYATNEHFNSTSEPYHVRHDREAKHLRHEISPRDRSPCEPLTHDEYKILLAFRDNTVNAGVEEETT